MISLSDVVLGNTLYQYVYAAGTFAGIVILVQLFKIIVLKKLKSLAEKTKSDFDDVALSIVRMGTTFIVFLAAYFSLKTLEVPVFLENAFNVAVLIVGVYFVVRALQIVVDYGRARMLRGREEDMSHIDLLGKLAKAVLWVFAAVFLMSNLGYDVTTLIAGLGIGGLAIAFALQNILGDIFASVSIHLDKPFRVGDFIIIGNDMGTVRHIGIKSTRIETLQGQELVVSNKELTEVRINNYKHMERRRIQFTFEVTYQTTKKQLQKIPEMVKGIINSIDLAHVDRVHFKSYASSGLLHEVVYYIDTRDYNKYMDIQHEINLGMKELFEKEKISFAYPTQTIILGRKK